MSWALSDADLVKAVAERIASDPASEEFKEIVAKALKAAAERETALLKALEEAKALCDQVESDLASAHAEICKLQGLDPKKYSWPAWTPQANTLRWVKELRERFTALTAGGAGNV